MATTNETPVNNPSSWTTLIAADTVVRNNLVIDNTGASTGRGFWRIVTAASQTIGAFALPANTVLTFKIAIGIGSRVEVKNGEGTLVNVHGYTI